jgi:D-alanyl-D-alanine carboxypeptidase
LIINIFIGASFAYPIFAERDNNQNSLSNDTEALSVPEETIESTIELALDSEVNTEELQEEESEYDLTSLEEYDSYSLAEILEERGDESGAGQTEQIIGAGEEIESEDQLNILFAADDWRLVLINKQHPIPLDYEYTLGTIRGSMQCDERIIDELLQMMQAALDDGVELVIISPYRNLAHQEVLFRRKIDSYMRRGLSYLEAYKYASQTVTIPGSSEHEIGLAIDITSRDYTTMNTGFADTEAGLWLSEHSFEYGFIVRYPLGKEYITGINFEPWHFRYVGKEAAKIIYENQITLEEFVEIYVP